MSTLPSRTEPPPSAKPSRSSPDQVAFLDPSGCPYCSISMSLLPRTFRGANGRQDCPIATNSFYGRNARRAGGEFQPGGLSEGMLGVNSPPQAEDFVEPTSRISKPSRPMNGA